MSFVASVNKLVTKDTSARLKPWSGHKYPSSEVWDIEEKWLRIRPKHVKAPMCSFSWIGSF